VTPTLASVANLSSLGLRRLTSASYEVPVRWVAVSELTDPTPFLEGGELVLTTGMRLDDLSLYVSRLAARGVAGLGFGVGLSHSSVPAELISAASTFGLPLLEVPRPTPFVAIGKAVSKMLAAEQYEDVTRAFQAQRELTRAALRGPEAVVARLATELRGWVLLLDSSGEVGHASSASARSHAPSIAAELRRLKSASSLALPGPIVVQPVGLGRRPRGYLAVGTSEPLQPVAHTIVGAAVSLLTLQHEVPRSERELRAALAGLLLGEVPAFLSEPMRVVSGRAKAFEALESDPIWERCLALLRPDGCLVIVPDSLIARVVEVLPPPLGIGGVASLDEVGRSLRESSQALAVARGGVQRYEDLPSQGLLHLIDPQVSRGFAEALLAPLDLPLRDSLHAYLAANGQGDPAAKALGIHRHTLRARMKKVAELLNRDLDEPGVRAELWIAFAAL
jgi:PucR family transcriptional regulator, purine catabolism regulatory protein